MAWAEAKTQIAVVLGGVAVTTPVAQTIKKVYTSPPGTLQDLPCFVIFPPACEIWRGSGGLRRKTYTVRLRLFVVDAYREATMDAFDVAVTLNATADNIQGPTAEEAAAFEYAGKKYTGMDFLLTVQLTELRTFEA